MLRILNQPAIFFPQYCFIPNPIINLQPRRVKFKE